MAMVAYKLPWLPGGHDGVELDIVSKFISDNPVILEAGAHYGEDTIKMISKWPRAKIYAFEPCPDSFKKLKLQVKNCPQIKIYSFGLFDKTGNYTFYVNALNDGSSSLLEDSHKTSTVYKDTPITIMCKNLDEWAQEEKVSAIDYMWLDMEGAEYYVLSAAPKILSTVKVISCELNFQEFRTGMTQFETLKSFLEAQGFVLYKIWGSSSVQATGIFVKKDIASA
jgi:FkbM family methyltransferase